MKQQPIVLDNMFTHAVSAKIVEVWTTIGSEVEEQCHEVDSPLTNATAIDTCIAHDRLVAIGNAPEVDSLIKAAIAEHTYKRVINHLSDTLHIL